MTKRVRYAVREILEAKVLSKSFDFKGRPYLEGEILAPSKNALCKDEKPAKFVRVYCSPSMSIEEQKTFICKYKIDQLFRARTNQVADCIPSTCLADFVDCFEFYKDIKTNQAVVDGEKKSFTVKNLDKELVDAVIARIESQDLTRAYVVKKLLKGFVAGKYDEDIFAT